jgi:methylated-DNA-[protein]-cysteine S-methyltransferase
LTAQGAAGHRHTTTDSPIGPLTLVVDAGGTLAGLYLPDHVPAPDPGGFGPALPVDDPAVAPLVAAVLAYLDGSSRGLEVPLAPATGTPFQLEVWRQVAAIPYGQTRTYGEVAAAAGRPGAHRAVGAAVGRNRQCLAVPCHRVVGTGGAVTGYAGGVERKRWLLRLEATAAGGPQPGSAAV